MNGESAAGRLMEAAREDIERAHALLLEPAPRHVEMASAALVRAAGSVQNLLAENREPASDLSHSAGALRARIADLAMLLDHAAAYHSHLLRTMMEVHPSPAVPSPARMGRRVHMHA